MGHDGAVQDLSGQDGANKDGAGQDGASHDGSSVGVHVEDILLLAAMAHYSILLLLLPL